MVGAGLAGTIISWKLHQSGCKFQIVDSYKAHSSRAAAGIMNPIVFKRLTKSWMADELLPYAKNFYTELEEILGEQLLQPYHIRRIFASVEEQNNWSSADERFQTYLNDEVSELPSIVNAPYGSGQVQTIGHLNTGRYLDLSHNYFMDQGIEIDKREFDFEEIDEDLEYIFCEGAAVKNNPYFNYLPLKPAHGEVLIVECQSLNIDEVLNRQLFIQPLGENRYKIGSTHNWELEEAITTDEGKQDILARFDKIVEADYKIIDHKAGIRPTVSDRRPLLGTHREKSNLHLFNGLGTKGVMLGPYFANQLLDSLQNGEDLMSEVDISRF